VCDPLVDADNDRGLVGQQWLALRRFWGAVRRRSGWRLGDVSFGPDYEPIPDVIRASDAHHGIDSTLGPSAYSATSRAARP
jgi:hypothetical protein